MGFDNLITIGIIIYIIYSVKKTFSNAKKDSEGKAEKAPGWAGKLGDVINQIKMEIEKANQQTTVASGSEPENNSSMWDGLREPPQKESQVETKTINQTLFYEPEKSPEKPLMEEDIPEIPEESHRNHPRAKDKPMDLPGMGNKQSRCFHINKSELKKAIVWSEILSKPVSLRD